MTDTKTTATVCALFQSAVTRADRLQTMRADALEQKRSDTLPAERLLRMIQSMTIFVVSLANKAI